MNWKSKKVIIGLDDFSMETNLWFLSTKEKGKGKEWKKEKWIKWNSEAWMESENKEEINGKIASDINIANEKEKLIWNGYIVAVSVRVRLRGGS